MASPSCSLPVLQGVPWLHPEPLFAGCVVFSVILRSYLSAYRQVLASKSEQRCKHEVLCSSKPLLYWGRSLGKL